MLIFSVGCSSTQPTILFEFVPKSMRFARNFGVKLMARASLSCGRQRLGRIAASINGVKTKSVCRLRSYQHRLRGAGVIGTIGVNAHGHVGVECLSRVDNATIQRRRMAVNSALVNGFVIKSVIWILVPRMSPVFEHNNARNSIMKLSVRRCTTGCLTLIVVSGSGMEVVKVQFLKDFDFIVDDACELYCTDSEETLIVPRGDNAADGTPCNIGTNDMCISGICRVSGTIRGRRVEVQGVESLDSRPKKKKIL